MELEQPDLSNWPAIYREIALAECQRAGIDFDEDRDRISFKPAGPMMGFIKVFIAMRTRRDSGSFSLAVQAILTRRV